MQSFLHVYFHIMVGFYQKLFSFLCIILTIVSYPRDTPYHCSVLNKLTLLTYQYETKQEDG